MANETLASRSIYQNRREDLTRYPDLYQWWAQEVRTIEELESMGFEWCSGVNLAERKKELLEEIARIEKEREKQAQSGKKGRK